MDKTRDEITHSGDDGEREGPGRVVAFYPGFISILPSVNTDANQHTAGYNKPRNNAHTIN